MIEEKINPKPNRLHFYKMYWSPDYKVVEGIVQQMKNDGYEITYVDMGSEESFLAGPFTDELLQHHGQTGWVEFETYEDLDITYCNAVVWDAIDDDFSGVLSFYDKNGNMVWRES